jgi:hypothetical protein
MTAPAWQRPALPQDRAKQGNPHEAARNARDTWSVLKEARRARKGLHQLALLSAHSPQVFHFK